MLLKISSGCRERLMTGEIIRVGEQIVCRVENIFMSILTPQLNSCLQLLFSVILTLNQYPVRSTDLQGKPWSFGDLYRANMWLKAITVPVWESQLTISRSWWAASVWNLFSDCSWTSDAYLLKPESGVWQVPTYHSSWYLWSLYSV